jgi:hypothetical protein
MSQFSQQGGGYFQTQLELQQQQNNQTSQYYNGYFQNHHAAGLFQMNNIGSSSSSSSVMGNNVGGGGGSSGIYGNSGGLIGNNGVDEEFVPVKVDYDMAAVDGGGFGGGWSAAGENMQTSTTADLFTMWNDYEPREN